MVDKRSWDKLMRGRTEPNWLIDTVLPFSARALLYADSGVGKTYAAVDMACHVAFGKAWQGHWVTQGRVYYVASENPETIDARVKAWEALHHGAAQWKEAHPSEDEQFEVIASGVDLAHSESVAELLSELEPAALVVIDTLLASSDSGDLVKPDDSKRMVSQINRIRERTGATVLIVHHTPDKGGNPMGGAVWRAALAVRMKLTRQHANGVNFGEMGDFTEGDKIILKCEKMTMWEQFEPQTLPVRLVRVVDPTTGKAVRVPAIATDKANSRRSGKKAAGVGAAGKRRRSGSYSVGLVPTPVPPGGTLPTFEEVWAEGVRDNAELVRRTGLKPGTVRSRKSRKVGAATPATVDLAS